MRTSPHGVDFIAGFEGFRARAYKPVRAEAFYTIGYGHYGPDVKPHQIVTQAQAKTLLEHDLQFAERAVHRLVKAPVTQRQFDALVSFCFNVGEGNLASSSLLRLVNQRRWKLATAQFGRWVFGANHLPLAGLVRRRAAEARMFYRHRPRSAVKHN